MRTCRTGTPARRFTALDGLEYPSVGFAGQCQEAVSKLVCVVVRFLGAGFARNSINGVEDQFFHKGENIEAQRTQRSRSEISSAISASSAVQNRMNALHTRIGDHSDVTPRNCRAITILEGNPSLARRASVLQVGVKLYGFSTGFAGIGFTDQFPGLITTGMNWL